MSIALALSLLAGTIGTSVMASRARRQQSLAEERFGDVRQLANTFMFDLYPQIRNLPGSTPAVKVLVQTSLTYLQKLEGSIELAAQDDLWLDIASAYNRLGDIQGKPGQGNLGDLDAALKSYEKSLGIATCGWPWNQGAADKPPEFNSCSQWKVSDRAPSRACCKGDRAGRRIGAAGGRTVCQGRR